MVCPGINKMKITSVFTYLVDSFHCIAEEMRDCQTKTKIINIYIFSFDTFTHTNEINAFTLFM